jgi:hypothetical protein
VLTCEGIGAVKGQLHVMLRCYSKYVLDVADEVRVAVGATLDSDKVHLCAARRNPSCLRTAALAVDTTIAVAAADDHGGHAGLLGAAADLAVECHAHGG